jgi:hypothetical protein
MNGCLIEEHCFGLLLLKKLDFDPCNLDKPVDGIT